MLPSVFRHSAFTTLWLGRILTNIATLIQSVTIGWLVYTLARQTHDEQYSMFLVGMVGLAQFTPMFLLALLAGETADRYDRRLILLCCGLLQSACAAAFSLLAMQPSVSLGPIFLVAGFFGIARAFGSPALFAVLPALVPREELPRAIAFNTLSVQVGTIAGPWAGGLLCASSPVLATGSSCLLYLVATLAWCLLLRMPIKTRAAQPAGASRLTMIHEGLRHLWGSKVVLGAISLDLFAVLLGGVTALLPAYAKDVLHIGPEGFGNLRSAFAMGAGATTLTLALWPLRRHAGKWMLGSVALYGVATLFFALSRQTGWSMLALGVAGCADSVSVFMRQNLVQLLTPDTMRGRVAAVSGLFISASNELGEFESGVAARLLGIIGSAVFGGVGSLLVTALWARLFPALRTTDHLAPADRQ
ncbi:MAG: MFS transporter [Desulfobulbus sp.]|jgi:MFS family permease|uniref:MFS transporter n=1 Tax=Desulfobulbus sp. TaxID=895 RepID=UPI002846EA26|nr:MFS transporter [Desulfobulbus sp.]MDR2549032.1 MFS transporter [Desulfobulbus sp.]